MKSQEVFQLGPFQFVRSGPILRDERGEIVPLRHQSLKVLDCLCQNAGTIVTKADLNQQVWGDTFVTDASLVQCIREIRRALSDDCFEIVRTFPRQGYMIESTVAATGDQQNNPGRPIIAVCQFADHSTGVDRDVLSDAIAEDLILALSRYPELSVVSRQASFGFNEAENRTKKIAARTGAQYILTGYQRKSNDDLRVGAALIDAKTDTSVWNGIYDLDGGEPFASQNEAVEKIVAAVDALIPSLEPGIGGAGKAAAVSHYLKALNEFMNFTEESLLRAEDLSQQSIQADPSSPFGYKSLCFVNLCRHEFGLWHERPGYELANAEQLAEKALSLSPRSPDMVMTRGVVFMYQGRLEDALACFEKTLLLNPYYGANRMNYSETLALIGEIPAALEQVELARKSYGVRPDWHYLNTAFVLWAAGKQQAAVDYARNVTSLPTTSIPFKCALLVGNGEIEAAKTEMAKFLVERPNHSMEIERFVIGKKFRDGDLADRWLTALKRAGMPERPRGPENKP